jgi:hypothetical protein
MPWDARRMVAELTVPEMEQFARSRLLAKKYERHFSAIQLQWFVAVMYEAMTHAVAVGYRMAKSDKRLPELKLQKWLDRVPGLVREKKKRRLTAAS